MRRRVQLFLLCILPLSAADPKWLKVKSPNFELFTTAGERKGRDTIQHFEKVRGFFQQAMSIKGSPLPVRIIQFGSEKEYQPFQISAAAAAYYLGGHDTDYIVLGPAGQYQAVVHEYVHLLVRHSGLELPTWYNEGLADFYSTLTRPLWSAEIIAEARQPRPNPRELIASFRFSGIDAQVRCPTAIFNSTTVRTQCLLFH